MKKMRAHFGHKIEFFAERLYMVLSDNTNLRRITFKNFIDKMYETLFSEDEWH